MRNGRQFDREKDMQKEYNFLHLIHLLFSSKML